MIVLAASSAVSKILAVCGLVIAVTAAVTGALTLSARLFAGPLGRWVDAHIGAATQPMQHAIEQMRESNSAQHADVRTALDVMRARLDDHIDAANNWRTRHQGDGR